MTGIAHWYSFDVELECGDLGCLTFIVKGLVTLGLSASGMNPKDPDEFDIQSVMLKEPGDDAHPGEYTMWLHYKDVDFKYLTTVDVDDNLEELGIDGFRRTL